MLKNNKIITKYVKTIVCTLFFSFWLLIEDICVCVCISDKRRTKKLMDLIQISVCVYDISLYI